MEVGNLLARVEAWMQKGRIEGVVVLFAVPNLKWVGTALLYSRWGSSACFIAITWGYPWSNRLGTVRQEQVQSCATHVQPNLGELNCGEELQHATRLAHRHTAGTK